MENQMNQMPAQQQPNVVSSFGETMPAEYEQETMNVIKQLSLNVTAPVLFNYCANMLSNFGKQYITKQDVFTFLVQCSNLGLNPLVKQIYGFVSRGKLAIVVSIDGWNAIANRNKTFDGVDFEFGPMRERELTFTRQSFGNGGKTSTTVPVKRMVADWIKCVVYRKDRSHPVCVTTFFDEAYTGTEPWSNQPMQMLQNRAFVNSIKKAFNVSAYADDDSFVNMDMSSHEETTFEQPMHEPAAPAPQIDMKPQSQLMTDIQRQTENVEIPELAAPKKRGRRKKAESEMIVNPEPSAENVDDVEQPVMTDVPLNIDNVEPFPTLPPLPGHDIEPIQEPMTAAPAPTPEQIDCSGLSPIGSDLARMIENASDETALKFFGLNIAQMTQLPEIDKNILRRLYNSKLNSFK